MVRRGGSLVFVYTEQMDTEMTHQTTELPKPEKYPLKLENWGDDSYMIISRGHHELDVFKRLVNQEYEHFGNFFESAYHGYFKATPHDFGTAYSPVGPNTRGAFPATIAQEGWQAEFGDKEWERVVFKNGDLVVPLHDELGPNPPLETCYGISYKGEVGFITVLREADGRPRKYNRVTAQYRIAEEQERAVGHRL